MLTTRPHPVLYGIVTITASFAFFFIIGNTLEIVTKSRSSGEVRINQPEALAACRSSVSAIVRGSWSGKVPRSQIASRELYSIEQAMELVTCAETNTPSCDTSCVNGNPVKEFDAGPENSEVTCTADGSCSAQVLVRCVRQCNAE